MTMHDRWTDQMSEYLDGELPPHEHAALEAHVGQCAECARTLAELRSVVARAASLGDRPPARDLWPGIAAMLGSDGAVTPTRRTPPRRFSFSVPQLAAAAAVIVALTGGGVWVLRPSTRQELPVTATAAPAPAPARSATVRNAASRPTANQTYDAAVSDLQDVLAAGRGRLDTATVRIIEKNLMTIDSAVSAARRAVQADPANGFLNEYLAHTMRRKIDLLRQAAALASAQS
ncbi:MAG: zf-HC2 domain-containing protein [Gemmatimonadota bacterium]